MDPRAPVSFREARLLRLNPAAERLLPGEHYRSGRSVRELNMLQEPDFEELLDRWELQLIEQGHLEEDFSYWLKEHRAVLHIHMIRFGDYILVRLRDVTLERQEVETLRRERELFRAVLHCAPDAIFAKDLEGRYTLINPAGARAIGAQPQDILGCTDEELFPTPDAQNTVEHDREVLAAGRPMTYESEDLAGGRTWQSTKGVLRDESGAITGLFGVCRDITERKRLERSLHDSEKRYRLVARATGDVLWDWNVARNEMHWSTARGNIFGERPQPGEATLRWLREHIHPEDRERASRTIHEVMEKARDSWSSEYRFRRADGTYAVVLERGYIGRDAAGRPERLIGAMMDVTERKEREERKAREAEQLELFMGMVGHDLGSPLASIRLSAQVMKGAANLTPAQRNTILRIETSTSRVSGLTRQLLDCVLARAGGVPVRPQPMDLAPVCRQVLEELQTIYPQRILQLEVEGDTLGRWDRERLQQALSDLVGNALEHGAGDHPIRVRLRDVEGEQRMEVNNQGVPIPPASMAGLFEPFRRGATAGRHASGGGVGLGLYIVREIARAHRGNVQVHSSQEEGTTFSLLLPRQPPVTPEL